MRRSSIAASVLVTLLLSSFVSIGIVNVPRATASAVRAQRHVAVLFEGELLAADLASFEERYEVTAVRPIVDAALISFATRADVDDVLARIRRDPFVVSAAENTYARREQHVATFSSSASSVSLNPACVLPNGTAASTITVTARDASNNPISGATVTLAQTPSGAGAVITATGATPGVTNASGVATFSVTSAVNSATPVVFTATVNGVPLSTDTVSVTFSNTCSSTVPTTVTLSTPNCIIPNGTAQTATFAVTAAGNVAVNNAGIASFQITGTNSPAMTAGSVETSTGVDNTFTAQLTAPSGSTGSRSFSVIVTLTGGSATTLTGNIAVCSGGSDAQDVTNDPLVSNQWWLNNVGQDIFIGLAHLLTATGLDQLLTMFPATPGHDIRWMTARALAACGGGECMGGGITVAVIDSGVDGSHPDLQGQISELSRSFDPASPTIDDYEGHGTFIAGLIAAKANNGIGVAGVAPDARVMALKDDLSSFSQALAIRYAAEQGAQVINISSGGPSANPIIGSAIEYATAAPFNTIVIASAGNSAMNGNPVMYPASFPHVTSVASIDPDGTRSFFSESNDSVDVAAPGGFMLGLQAIGAIGQSDCTRNGTPYQSPPFSISISYDGPYDCIFTDGQTNGGHYTSKSGTSFSAPLVAAAAVLAKQRWSTLTSDQFEHLVRSTADLAPGQATSDTLYGAGTLNLQRLLAVNFPPEIASGSIALTRPIVANSGSDTTQVVVRVVDMEGSSDIRSVSLDAGALELNGITMTMTNDGEYSSPILPVPASITPGDYAMTVTALDAAGGVATATTALHVLAVGQMAPPAAIAGTTPDVSISISKPSTRSSQRVTTSKKTLALSGGVGDGVAHVEVNGDPADLDALAKTWGTKVKLKQGTNKLRVTSYDVTRAFSEERTITVTLDARSTAVDAPSAFSDVPQDHFAARAIAQLKELRIVSGDSGQFRPYDAVTRAEFAKMLAGVMRSPPGSGTTLTDVPAGHPLAGFIAVVLENGWATGQSGLFRPNAPITRIESAAMIARAKRLNGSRVQFTDIADPVLRQYASAVATAGIATGQDGGFAPSRALTRGEAAKMLAAIL